MGQDIHLHTRGISVDLLGLQSSFCSDSSRVLMPAFVATNDPGDFIDAVLLDFQLDVSVVAIGVVNYPAFSSRPWWFPHGGAEDREPLPEASHDIIDHFAVGWSLAADGLQSNPTLIESRIGKSPRVYILEQLDQLLSRQRGVVVVIPFRHIH
jgi:hypothetical protein